MVRLGGDGRVRPTTTVDAMAARLGRVLYLAFTGLAVILAVFCLVIAGLIIVNGDPYAAPWVAVLYGWMPVASWLIGRVQAPPVRAIVRDGRRTGSSSRIRQHRRSAVRRRRTGAEGADDES